MDLDLALWYYNPAAVYVLTTDRSAIAAWLSPTIPQPTQAQLNAAWAQAQAQLAAQAAATQQRTQHLGALAALKPTLTGNSTTMANDITAIQNLIAAIEAGTQPTAAQVLQTLRFILRALAVLNS